MSSGGSWNCIDNGYQLISRQAWIVKQQNCNIIKITTNKAPFATTNLKCEGGSGKNQRKKIRSQKFILNVNLSISSRSVTCLFIGHVLHKYICVQQCCYHNRNG